MGQDAGGADTSTLRAALNGVDREEAFIPAVASSTIEGQRRNDFYSSDKEYL